MDIAIKTLAVFLPLLYLLVSVCYGFLFFAGSTRAERLARPLLHLTLAAHLVYLIVLALRWHQFPAATVSQALSAVAFAIATVYAFVEWHGQERSTGFWLVSLACLFEVLSSLLRTPQPPYREIFHSPLFSTHVGFGLLGYAGFAVAAGYGFLFLRLYREIKRGRFSTFFGKLPPLEVLDKMMTGALLGGFAALTAAVLSGGVWAQQIFEGDWRLDPKILFTWATWAFYGLALALRHLHRWQGRQTAIASLAGFAAVLFSLLAVNLFLTDVHDFM